MDSKYLDWQLDFHTSHHNLPHWHQNGKLQFVTFHLADSLPAGVLERLRAEKKQWLEKHPIPWSRAEEKEYHHRFSQFVDRWLDAGYGSCLLRICAAADILEQVLNYFNGERYILHAYVIMGNHVHVLVETGDIYTIQSIMHSWKSFSASAINKAIGRKGKLWMNDSFERMIRDARHYNNVRTYIHKNIMRGGVRWKL